MGNCDLNCHLIGAANNTDTNGNNDSGNSGTESNCVEYQYNYENGNGFCLSMVRLTISIISLSIHLNGLLLVVALGQCLFRGHC